MPSTPATIKDIARLLGISVSTVSRALKDHPDISVDTKEKVNETARKLNYRPNALALGLKSSKSNTIGVIIPEIVHFFFSSVISGIEDAAYEAGYNVMVCQTNEMYERETMVAKALLDHRVEGILVSIAKTSMKFDHLTLLQDNGIPLVFFDRICSFIESDAVVVDDYKGAYMATEHLIAVGCRNIVHLAAPENLLIGELRKIGYCRALEDHNLPVDPYNIYLCDTRERVEDKITRILARTPKPDGFFAVNDTTAIAVIQEVKKAGFRVPDDIAVTGFGDGPVATIISPTLTTVEQNGYEIGYEAARFLLDRITKSITNPAARKKVFEPQLIKRESTDRKV
ncbi:MAG: LacI family DNA-binding transcriptional regulator [Bacteroidales bacterium]|nr:LacI family DNA-binding transcriptional regulator [Bacteroidales bacterium]